MGNKVRFTISLDEEVHEIFVRMAESSGMSLSRVVGLWLEDTCEGAQFVAGKMEEIRRFPRLAVPDVAHHWEATAMEAHEGGGAAVATRSGASVASPRSKASPPSSNTGGKPPRTSKRVER